MAELTKEIVVVYDKILVVPDKSDKKSGSGIIIAGSSDKKEVESGLVISTGKGYPVAGRMSDDLIDKIENRDGVVNTSFMALEVKSGDYITYIKDMAVSIMVDGKFYSVVPESGVVCIERDKLIGG